MWLLDTNKLELVEVSEESAPRYAILSHTWSKEEVTLQEIQEFSHRRWSRVVSQTVLRIQAKKGFAKIRGAAALAAKDGYSHIWIDTCCIDKSSSAELSEAINSMFRWYQRASICYAYMEDVRYGYHDRKGGLFHLLCQGSRWFTRGWTLQELIAPEDVLFYGEDWEYLGSKAHDEDVRISLANITGADVRVLESIIQPSEISIAARMKWASNRQTTRLEDMAYCLMGLFGVNMPLLYGEGTKAFIRLQEEILKVSNDHSIFTWTNSDLNFNEVLSGMLAETPQYFAAVQNYRPMPPSVSQGSTTWSITNQGLRLSLFLIPIVGLNGNPIQDEYDAVLECVIRRGDEAYQSPAIRIRRLYGDQFARVDPQTIKRVVTPSFDPIHSVGSYETIFIKQKPVYAVPDFMVSFSNIIQPSGSQDFYCHALKVWPEKYWDEEAATLRAMPSHSNRIVGLFRFSAPAAGATVDFAVGLERKPGGAWVAWHVQRPSMGEPLHQAAASVNGCLASASLNMQQPIEKPDPFGEQPDWVGHPWKKIGGKPIIQIRVEKKYVHGRLYHFIKASLAFELYGSSPSCPSPKLSSRSRPRSIRYEWPYNFGCRSSQEMADISSLGIWGIDFLEQPQGPDLAIPPSPLFPTPTSGLLVELPTDKTIQTQRLTHLYLLEDITIPNSLDYYLSTGYRDSMTKWRSKIRTTWAYPPIADLEKLEVWGVEEKDTNLLRACKNGRDQAVLELIHSDLECRTWQIRPATSLNLSGFRPIHWAVVGGNTEVIRILLNDGADFYSKTTQGWSLVHLAALLGRFVAMKWLIEYAVGRHAFSYEDVLMLDDRSNPLLESPLHLAVSHISVAVGDEILALTEILGKLGDSTFWTSANDANETLLHRLAASGPIGTPSTNIPIMEKFLPYERNFQYRRMDKLGRTVLWHAVSAGSVTGIKYLLKYDTSALSIGDQFGMTPLHVACRLGHSKAARALLKAGANPDATTIALGLTAAHYATIYDYPRCLQELITYGADVHKPTDLKETSFRPIHLAAVNGNSRTFAILRDAGGDMEWRCTHYISRPASLQTGQFKCQFELVECDASVKDLSLGYQGRNSPDISSPQSASVHNSSILLAHQR
ncbi:hypothetical protein F5Y19DRAFT_484255 [Xylariaceae sp. FL1651]|nr:hypothetical protein F5Y19DRAFT_484255 [Xylariaceae sp. FL1651]